MKEYKKKKCVNFSDSLLVQEAKTLHFGFLYLFKKNHKNCLTKN